MTLKIMQFIHATIILQIHLSGFIEDLATDWKKEFQIYVLVMVQRWWITEKIRVERRKSYKVMSHPTSVLEWLIKAYIKFKYFTNKFRYKNKALKSWKIPEQEKR